MWRLESAEVVTLSLGKCEFAEDKIQFWDTKLVKPGYNQIPRSMKPPSNITALHQLLCMINQCGKFPKPTKPLRVLLAKNCKWQWNQSQDDAYAAVKKEILKPTILTIYNPEADPKISPDASSFGLGAVLLQKEGKVDIRNRAL